MNARQELIEILKEYGYAVDEIKCYKIILDEFEMKNQNIDKNILIKGQNYEDLLNFLDFEYDDGYGLQLIDGVVLMNDGNWFERNEYDGSEWWEFRKPLTCEDIL